MLSHPAVCTILGFGFESVSHRFSLVGTRCFQAVMLAVVHNSQHEEDVRGFFLVCG